MNLLCMLFKETPGMWSFFRDVNKFDIIMACIISVSKYIRD